MCDHDQTAIFYPGDDKAIYVDSGIAPLISALWQSGIMTASSCQEVEAGMMEVEFCSAEDLEDFLTLLLVGMMVKMDLDLELVDWLNSRIMGGEDNGGRAWKFEARPIDCEEYLKGGPLKGEPPDGKARSSMPSGIALTVTARFSVADYQTIMELIGD